MTGRNVADTVRAVLGHGSLVVVDVGAAHGLPAHVSVLQDVADLLLFEPDEKAAHDLEDRYGRRAAPRATKVFPVALSREGGRRTLYVTNTPTGSSLLRPREAHAREIGDPDYFFPTREVAVETHSLASVLDDAGIGEVDLMKLDVQGAEYEVLQGLGASRSRSLLAVELEIGMPGAYEDQPSFSEIDLHLRALGLRLFDLRPARSHRGVAGNYAHYPEQVFGVHCDSPTLSKRLWEVDALYFRESVAVIDAREPSAVRRLATLHCTYGFFPEAHHLIASARAGGLLAEEEAASLESAVERWHRELHYCLVHSPAAHRLLQRARSMARRLLCGRRVPRWLE